MEIFELGLLLLLVGEQMREIDQTRHALRSADRDSAHETASCRGYAETVEISGSPSGNEPAPSIAGEAATSSIWRLQREILGAAEPQSIPSWIKTPCVAVLPSRSTAPSVGSRDGRINR